jgi:phosphate transport system substrate-binding protein
VTEAVAEDFQKAKKQQVKVTVGISGTGGGFKKFCRGETDISNASRPILKAEMADCAKAGIEYFELPVAFDALTVVINPKNTFIKQLTVAEMKKIWEPAAQGKVTRWNQVNPAWPDQPMKLFGPGADSGTFDYFTEAINGKAKASRSDYLATEDDNVVVQGVEGERGSLGYFGYSYYEENKDKLKVVAVDAGKGCIAPSVQSVQSNRYRPLSRPLFIYAKRTSFKRPVVAGFIGYIFNNEKAIAKKSGFIALTDRQLRKARYQYLQALKLNNTSAGGIRQARWRAAASASAGPRTRSKR